MDMQKLLDAVLQSSAMERAKYHLTLGALTDTLKHADPATPVRLDTGAFVSKEGSYRGYYDELAFSGSSEPTTAGEVLRQCRRAKRKVYEGYKGGDYRYTDATPLWAAPYGCCGVAIVGVKMVGDEIVLETRVVDL